MELEKRHDRVLEEDLASCCSLLRDVPGLFIPVALTAVNTELPFNTPFGLIIGVYITLNESISICENLYEINPMTLPKWIMALMRKTSEKIDDGGEKSDDK